MQKMEGVRRATGRDRAEWFALLDDSGHAGRPFREVLAFLTTKHGLSRWWAQKLIVEYEQERGIRAPGVRKNGTFEVGASKTVAAPVGAAFNAFIDSRRRRKWLTDGSMRLRASRAGKSARFDWSDGGTRVNAMFEPKGPSKCTVSVTHERIPDADEAQAIKTRWKERLADLKDLLES